MPRSITQLSQILKKSRLDRYVCLPVYSCLSKVGIFFLHRDWFIGEMTSIVGGEKAKVIYELTKDFHSVESRTKGRLLSNVEVHGITGKKRRMEAEVWKAMFGGQNVTASETSEIESA